MHIRILKTPARTIALTIASLTAVLTLAAVPVWADGYATDVDALALGGLLGHPGDPAQDNWYAVIDPGAVAEIQDGIANTGRAIHLMSPISHPSNWQTIARRDITPPDLQALPIITFSLDFYAGTSDQGAINYWSSEAIVTGGPHPGYEIIGMRLTAGGGIPRNVTGLDLVVNGFDPELQYNRPIELTVGQDLAWDTWHSLTIVIDQALDKYLSITVDGETQVPVDICPVRTYYEGEWLRGGSMEAIHLNVVTHDWEDPPSETDDHFYIDNLSLQAEASPNPIITGISDVGNDQGRQVRIEWNRSLHDAAGEPVVTGYDIYRREDEGRLAGWDYLLTVPACGDEAYQCIAPTLCDSTIADGVCWSAFLIRARTPDLLEFFESTPDSGYSVDNLAPDVPDGFKCNSGTLLVWEPSTAADFDFFTVFGSEVDHLDGTAEHIAYTIDTGFDVAGHAFPYYHLTATDFAGNEGEAATVLKSTAVPDALPAGFALYQNAPNPFNPSTMISFTLPTADHARLAIYTVDGRRVVTLVNGQLGIGRHEVEWDGCDDSGRRMPSGMYFYRLETERFVETKRMTLVK